MCYSGCVYVQHRDETAMTCIARRPRYIVIFTNLRSRFLEFGLFSLVTLAHLIWNVLAVLFGDVTGWYNDRMVSRNTDVESHELFDFITFSIHIGAVVNESRVTHHFITCGDIQPCTLRYKNWGPYQIRHGNHEYCSHNVQ